MADRHDVNRPDLLRDAVDDAEITSVGAVQTLKLEAEWSTGTLWVVGRYAVDELNYRRSNLLR